MVSKVDARNATDGIQGLKALGVRELTYKMAFLSSSVQVSPLICRGREGRVRVGGQ